jgi:hypothetical protein
MWRTRPEAGLDLWNYGSSAYPISGARKDGLMKIIRERVLDLLATTADEADRAGRADLRVCLNAAAQVIREKVEPEWATRDSVAYGMGLVEATRVALNLPLTKWS